MAMPELVNRGLGFVRREWPLCLFAVLSLLVIVDYPDPAMRRAALAGLLGGVFCLKRFGLDHFSGFICWRECWRFLPKFLWPRPKSCGLRMSCCVLGERC